MARDLFEEAGIVQNGGRDLFAEAGIVFEQPKLSIQDRVNQAMAAEGPASFDNLRLRDVENTGSTLRATALAGRAATTGLTGLPALAAQGLAWPVNKLIGSDMQPLAAWQSMLDKMYGVAPETPTERVTSDIIGGMSGAGAMARGSQIVADQAKNLATRNIAGAMAVNPAMQAVSGATGGAGAGMARESGLGPTGQLLSGLAAATTPYLAVQGARGFAAVPRKLTEIIDTAVVPGGEKRAATRVLGEVATEGRKFKTVAEAERAIKDIDDLTAALRQSPIDETAPQALTKTGNAPMVALKNIAEGELPTRSVAVSGAQEKARMAALQAVIPDEQAAIRAREAATAPLYKAASNQTVPVTKELKDIFARLPTGTKERASEIAKMKGNVLVNKTLEGETITGENLHIIKRALSDIASGKTAEYKIGSDVQREAAKLLDDYVNVLGGTANKPGLLPVYKQARDLYAKLSVPVNQAKVLKEMQAELAKPGGGERVGPFMNVLGKGESALLKRATGFPRYESGDLSKVLSPKQLEAVNKIAGQFERDIAQKELASAGLPKALAVMREVQQPANITGSVLERKITITNNILRILEAKGGKKVDQEIARLMMPENKAELADVLVAAKPQTRALLIKEMAKEGIKLPGATVGALLAKPSEE